MMRKKLYFLIFFIGMSTYINAYALSHLIGISSNFYSDYSIQSLKYSYQQIFKSYHYNNFEISLHLSDHKMKLPFIYVRDKHKKHGRQNKIEGEIGKNRKILVVEDLISTGKSSLNVAETLKKKNCEITGIISIFNYNFSETEYLMKTHNIKALSLCNFHDLISQAKESNYISDEEYENILNWHSNFKV